MQPKPGSEIGRCGCGRSPTGKCMGWHALSENEYQSKLESYLAEEQDRADLEAYKKQAQELWSDSCTTSRAK